MSIEVDPLTAFVEVDVSGDVVEVEVVGQGEKGDPGGGAFDGDASDVPYTPATEGDWDPVPAQVAEALDELAAGGGGGAVDSVNGQTGAVVLDAGDVGADPAGTAAGLVDDLSGVTNAATARSNLGLGNVDNTSDANKPVSSAQQTALDGKAATSHSHSGADITSGTVATARLGSGTANATTFLRGDQTWAHPMMRELPLSSGSFVALPAAGVGTVGANGAAGRLYLIPIWLPAGTYDRVGVATTAAGTATWRLGAYKADPSTLMPDGTALVQEFGTINLSVSPGNLLITTTFTVPTSALYWMAVLVDSYSSAPSVSGWHAGYALPPPVPWMPHAVFETPIGRSTWLRNVYSGVPTGAVPATCPTTAWGDTGPQVRLRVA